MIIKADEEGLKVLSEIVDSYLKANGLKAMNLIQKFMAGISKLDLPIKSIPDIKKIDSEKITKEEHYETRENK